MKLEAYIKKIFNMEVISPRIYRQMRDYVEKNHYSYDGILKSLIYSVEVKKNPIEKMNFGIGIVGYVYDEACRYYYTIWMAQQANVAKDVKQYVPEEEEVFITPPARRPMKKSKFKFLD